jgi:hypothetical protein
MNLKCLTGHRYNLGTKRCSRCDKPAKGKDLQFIEEKRAMLKVMFERSEKRGKQ